MKKGKGGKCSSFMIEQFLNLSFFFSLNEKKIKHKERKEKF